MPPVAAPQFLDPNAGRPARQLQWSINLQREVTRNFVIEASYVAKGGRIEDTVGRKCLCNGLTAGIQLGQRRRDGYNEVPIVTLGADLDGVAQMLADLPEGWTAVQAVDRLLGD